MGRMRGITDFGNWIFSVPGRRGLRIIIVFTGPTPDECTLIAKAENRVFVVDPYIRIYTPVAEPERVVIPDEYVRAYIPVAEPRVVVSEKCGRFYQDVN